jgi:thioredoxin 1
MAILHLNSENFKEVVTSNEVIVVDFWAAWCGPCRMLGEVLEEINRTNPELVIGKVNVDEERGLAQEFQIRSIPQIFVFKNGKIVKNISGYVPANTILEAVK